MAREFILHFNTAICLQKYGFMEKKKTIQTDEPGWPQALENVRHDRRGTVVTDPV